MKKKATSSFPVVFVYSPSSWLMKTTEQGHTPLHPHPLPFRLIKGLALLSLGPILLWAFGRLIGGQARFLLFNAACDFWLLLDMVHVIVWARVIVIARVFSLVLTVATLCLIEKESECMYEGEVLSVWSPNCASMVVFVYMLVSVCVFLFYLHVCVYLQRNGTLQ